MNPIKEKCIDFSITRLCHFTESRNLAHIFGDTYKILSTKTLKNNNMPYNPTDLNRYDGRDDLICCSIEYPNIYYFARAKQRERLFKDWVVLFIDHKHLWAQGTCFYPCNAASQSGKLSQQGIKGFMSLYANSSRLPTHLPAAPTDIQAEVQVREPIELKDIIGIAVKSKKQAQQELFRFDLQKLSMDKRIYIVPSFFKREKLRGLIRQGIRANERRYKPSLSCPIK